MIVAGKISVKAILENRKRNIKTVYILESKRDGESRYVLAKAKGLEVKRVSREFLDTLTNSTSHGGYAIMCEGRLSDPMDTLLKSKAILCVEGVSDPYNMGEILRTIYALGFDAVLTSNYEFYEHEMKLIRASAGASEKITWVKSDDLEASLEQLKHHGVKVVTAYRGEQSHSLVDYKFPKAFVLCMGGALRGLSSKILALSDESVRLDYDARVALSTVGATSAFAYAYYASKEE